MQLRFELEQVILEERDSFGDPRSTIVVRATNQPAPRPRPSGRRQQELLGELERRHRTGERSWDDITISDVATRAHVSLAAFRDYYPSKGAVLAGAAVTIKEGISR